jgi:lipopolysaccharide/colanic/teichoic acid biosynthesis glycosyltransferase
MITKALVSKERTKAKFWQEGYAIRLRLTDSIVVAMAVVLAQYVRFGMSPLYDGIPQSRKFLHSVILMALWLSALAIFKTRSERVLGSGVIEYRRVLGASLWIFGFIAIASLLFKLEPSRGYLAVALPAGTIGLLLTRWLWRQRVLRQRRRGDCVTNLIVIGQRDAVSELAGELIRNPDGAYRIAGVGVYGQVERDDYLLVGGQRVPILGDEEDAVAAAGTLNARTVALAGPERLGGNGLRYLLWELERQNVNLLVSPTASPLVISQIPGYPLLQVESPQNLRAKRFSKRVFDVIFASVALVLTSPLLLLAAVAMKLTSRGPVVYREDRIGLGGATFQMVKLRTIPESADAMFESLSVTVGRVLRRFNVDEIPQLVNVLRGEMSVLGPPPRRKGSGSTDGDLAWSVLARPGLTGLSTKRFLDVCLVVLAMPVWLPLLAIIGLLKFAADGSPLLYLSQRIGRGGEPFTVFKFRTMVDDPEFIQDQISRLGRIGFEAIPLNSPVYTKAGRVFERLQFVELPQLLNILKGDMSLIGYRPLPKSHVDVLGQTLGRDAVLRRHTYAPGITGFAQLSGKSLLTNESRLEIEIAEADFFATSSPLACLKTYFAILFSTALYVAFGSSQRAIRLRDRCLPGAAEPAKIEGTRVVPISLLGTRQSNVVAETVRSPTANDGSHVGRHPAPTVAPDHELGC